MGRLALIIAVMLLPLYLFGQNAIEYNQLGEKKLAENDVYSALEYFSRSIELNPSYNQALYGMAISYFRLGEYEAAKFYIGLAEQKSRNNLQYINLEGRIEIGLSDLDGAGKLFSKVLKMEPYNMPARLGLAEIDLIENRFSEAESKYLDSLSISPESKRALLSLLLLYDTKGDFAKGDDILAKLNDLYPYDSEVKLDSAQHYHRKGDLDKAEQDALSLLTIDSASEEVRPLLARIYLEKGEADKSIGFLEEQLKSNRDDLQLRYLLAVSYSKTGRITESLHNFDFILKNAPYDEISRITAENLAVANKVTTSIQSYADYHFARGKELENQYKFDQALTEYRRGLKINPESVQGRLDYAGIFEKQGFNGKYMDILNLLAWNGYKDPAFLSKKKQLEHQKVKTLTDQWSVNQFDLPRQSYVVDIYVRKPDIQTSHSLSEETIAGYYGYRLEKYSWFELNGDPSVINRESEAYRKSHNSGSDYYFVLDYFESDRIFSMKASIYLSRTGALIDTYSVLRAGNGKVGESIGLATDYFSRLLPLRGSIVKLDNGKALINLGTLDGVVKDKKFIVVRKNKVRLTTGSPWFEVADEDKLGLLTVTDLDEAVAQCSVENPGFFDLVNRGDEVFLLPDGKDVQLKSTFGYNESLKRELLRIY